MVALYAILGLIIGSFLNVLILRTASDEPLTGRSHCPQCRKQLSWYDLIPVFSWLMLRGRCRSCSTSISIQYPLVELATAALFVAVGFAPLTPLQQACGLIFVALCVAITVYDLQHALIPDAWSYPLALVALAYGATFVETWEGLAWLMVAGPVAALPLFLLWALSRGRWMGFGDVKLAFAIGWLLGPFLGFFSVMFAFVIGAVVSVTILLPLPYLRSFAQRTGSTLLSNATGHFTMKSEVPFGPFLIASCLFVWFSTLYGFAVPLLP